MAEKHKGGKKNRKYNRNRTWCEAYRARGQREINKARKQARHRRQVEKHRMKLEWRRRMRA